MGKLLALVSILVVAQPAYAQVKCGNDAIRDFQSICGRNIDEGPCNVDEAKEAVDWVLFKDTGAQGTFRESMKACKYSNAFGHVFLSITHAQRHNQNAMCNLLACYGPIAQHPVNYLSTIDYRSLLN